MSFVRQLISLPLRRPRFAALPALAVLWLGWLLWPPQPDIRFVGPPGLFAEVLPNGRQATFYERFAIDRGFRQYRALVIDVRTGRETPVYYTASRPQLLVAPNGKRVVTQISDTHYELRSWPSADLVCALPDGDWTIKWSPDGRYLALIGEMKSIIVESASGEVFSRLLHGPAEPVFLPDNTGFCTPTSDQSGIECVDFEGGGAELAYRWPNLRGESSVNVDDVPIWESLEVRKVVVSEDCGTLAALAVRRSCIGDETHTSQEIVTWNRRTGRSAVLDIRPHSTMDKTELTISRDGQTICVSILPNCCFGGFPLPGSTKREWSRAFAWRVADGKAVECDIPRDLHHVSSCGGYIVCYDLYDTLIYDGRSGQLVRKLPGTANGCASSTQSARAFAQVISDDLPAWLPDWLHSILWKSYREGHVYCNIVRLRDGVRSRAIPYCEVTQFDSDCNFWTFKLTAAGGQLIERWSPETPHPWWLYAVTAAGVGYLIWPAFVRLTSRWRQTRPAGIAA